MKMSRMVSILLCQLALIASTAFAGNNAVLTITGNIEKSNQPDKKSYVFSLQALKQLPHTVVHTKTKWTAESDFAGPTIRDILKAVGAKADAKEVTVQTVDNYPVTIPIADFQKWDVVLAHSLNGKRLPAAKAPLWVIYPFDAHPAELNNNDTLSKSAWAVKGLIVQ